MAKRNDKPDYEALYPGVGISAGILNVLKKSDRMMECMECGLKAEAGVANGLLPSRKDFFECLLQRINNDTNYCASM